MLLKLLALLFVLAAAQRSFVSPAPTPADSLERSLGLLQNGARSTSYEKSPGTHQFDNAHAPASSLDEEVKELERLKPSSSGNEGISEGRTLEGPNSMGRNPMSESMSVMKSHASMYSNVNGRVQGQVETKQEVNKNGETIAKIRQNIEAKNVDHSATPETNILTAVDIPGQNIHKIYRQHHPVDSSDNNILNVLNILEPVHPKRILEYPQWNTNVEQTPVNNNMESNVQASPKDIAEYVFWTGDEKSVTSAIEDYMRAGLMNREEAITLLEDIKLYLGDIQDHYDHEKLKHQMTFSRNNEIPQAGMGSFPISNLKRNADFENTELNQIRQQLIRSNYNNNNYNNNNNNYNKRTSSQIINSVAQSKYPSYASKSTESSNNVYDKFTEEDYEELIEKLKVADLQYQEYSLEDIIYQLAKVMFAQSLAHGNSEAQDALQKFTSFLETDVDQGRISRALEKKVIDILITSLSDTLNEHPEFLNAARGDNVHPHMSLYSGRGEGVHTRPPMGGSNFPGVEDKFRRNMIKPAMKKRNIQSSGILDAASKGGISMMNKKAFMN